MATRCAIGGVLRLSAVEAKRAITFVIPDPPPIREHPGRGAGRDSPHADLLVQAAEALIAENPDGFPWQFSGMTTRFGRTMWDTDPLGYSPDSPLYEVLCDAGAICDPGGWWSYTSQDPDSSIYIVTFVSEEDPSVSNDPMGPFVYTDVPTEFHGLSVEQGPLRAKMLLEMGEPYLSPERVPLIRSFVYNNEPELGLEAILDDLLLRAEPLPETFVNELLSSRDQIANFDGQLQDRLSRLARLARRPQGT